MTTEDVEPAVCASIEEDNTKAADDIAKHITKLLIDAFEAKENRNPTNEEIAEMLEELTEERISVLMGEREGSAGDDESEEDEESLDEAEEDGDDNFKESNNSKDEKVPASIETACVDCNEKRGLEEVNDENTVNQEKRARTELDN